MLKFIVDESTGLYVARELRNDGFDVISVIEILPGDKNGNILSLAKKEERILITNDKDFGELVYRQNKDVLGVILLRLENDVPSKRIAVLRKVINTYKNRLENKFIVASETKVRLRDIK